MWWVTPPAAVRGVVQRYLGARTLGDDVGSVLDYYARHKLMFRFVRPG